MTRCQKIRWRYNDEDAMFKMLCLKNGLRARMNVPCITLASMILRNALVCINGGCKTAAHYNCRPPRFEHWIANGPRELSSEKLEEILGSNKQ
jgi:hypothetical protein